MSVVCTRVYLGGGQQGSPSPSRGAGHRSVLGLGTRLRLEAFGRLLDVFGLGDALIGVWDLLGLDSYSTWLTL